MRDGAATGFGRSLGQRSKLVRMREELRAKLRAYNFTHFITLASNHQPLGYPRMRNLLKEWDARVNRDLNGPRWQERPDERLLWFAFPEKMEVNPHWHLIAEVDPVIETATRAARTDRLAAIGERHWLRLVRQGSFDCQGVDSSKVIDYVTKMSAGEMNFENFIVFREFMSIR